MKVGPKNSNGKHTRKLSRREAESTEKHVSNIRIISKEADILKERKMQAGTLSEEEALLTALIPRIFVFISRSKGKGDDQKKWSTLYDSFSTLFSLYYTLLLSISYLL